MRARSRPLEDELRIRNERVEELRRGVWRKPVRTMLPAPTSNPVWSKRPTTDEALPWSVVRREEATRPFEIALQGDVSWTILRAVREIEGEQLETGAYLLAWERPRLRSVDVIDAVSSPEMLHGPNSLKLGSAEAAVAQLPDYRHPDELRVVGCVHSHPGGDPRPSMTDINAWAARL